MIQIEIILLHRSALEAQEWHITRPKALIQYIVIFRGIFFYEVKSKLVSNDGTLFFNGYYIGHGNYGNEDDWKVGVCGWKKHITQGRKASETSGLS